MLLTILLVLFIILALGGLFYRPFGNNYYGYVPSLVLFLIAVVLLLYVLGVL